MEILFDNIEKNIQTIIRPLGTLYIACKTGSYILLMNILWSNTSKAWTFNDNPMMRDILIYMVTIILLGIILFHKELKTLVLNLEEKQVVTN